MNNLKVIKRLLSVLISFFICFTLLSACNAEEKPQPAKATSKIKWIIMSNGEGSENISGRACDEVFSRFADRISIEFCDDDYNILLSEMLVAGKLPELVTLPLGGELERKIIGSGELWMINDISQELVDRIPNEISEKISSDNGIISHLVGGYNTDFDSLVAKEGLYVREEYYSLLGNPNMDTTTGFVEAMSDFVELITENNLIGYDGIFLPVVFGVNNVGFSTVEHICGLVPLYNDGAFSYHRVFNPKVEQVLSFFDKLTDFSQYHILDEYSDKKLTELMKENVFAYIGPSAFVEKYNIKNNENRFIEIKPFFLPDGFLEAENPYGVYGTFVSKKCDKKIAEDLLLSIYNEKSSKSLMYGIEGKDWVTANGEIVKLQTTYDAMQNNAEEFLHKSGIAAFPFLSSDGIVNPYIERKSYNVKNISDYSYFLPPSDYQGYYNNQLERYLYQSYIDVVKAGVTVEDVLLNIKTQYIKRKPIIFN